MSEALAAARETVRTAGRVVFLTGAGVSAESGIPTFRDADGMWSGYRPEELATPEGFARDPRRVWEWYGMRRNAIRTCRPNPGHRAIARFMRARAATVLVTQNVDALHHRALDEVAESGDPGGPTTPSGHEPAHQRILELHGNILRDRCSRCAHRPDSPLDVDASGLDALPRCPSCDALLRPDVVWFGELLDADTLDRAFSEAGRADVCVVAGTSAVVHPAASVPVSTLEAGGSIIEVNPEKTPLSPLSTWSLQGASGEVLPALLSDLA